ncbi:CLAVATA3/ESR-related 39 [Senna tora]|uniref:CLAVATA3/ESR-related 39 n=1 Tax=Senna tora TaxID=362788 RepID=A0A834WGX8_9FABA|nr:CLAVATA3/ESR-related 39 [Senna tora]
MRIIMCRVLGLILLLIVFFSSFCVAHEQRFSRDTRISRKLLSVSSVPEASVSTNVIDKLIISGKPKNKKAVEPSLRKAPPSVPNPIQNK